MVKTLSSEQKKRVNALWGGVKVQYKWVAFYNVFSSGGFDERYIPDNLYYGYIDPYYNDVEKAKIFDDKCLYDLWFPEVKKPRTLVHKISDSYLDENYCPVSIDQVVENCKSVDGVIFKPSTMSLGGHGISIWRKGEDFELMKDNIVSSAGCVVQELVKQHSELNALHQESVNTIRVIALYDAGRIYPLSGIVRMGVDNNCVDNASAGGIFCGINEDGKLKAIAYNKNGKAYERHPQGAIFSEHYIPGYDKIIMEICQLAPRLSSISKLTSWDFAIDEYGDPVFIEVNMAYGEIDFHQIANGPLFGDMTNGIIQKVFSNKLNKFLNKFF